MFLTERFLKNNNLHVGWEKKEEGMLKYHYVIKKHTKQTSNVAHVPAFLQKHQ